MIAHFGNHENETFSQKEKDEASHLYRKSAPKVSITDMLNAMSQVQDDNVIHHTGYFRVFTLQLLPAFPVKTVENGIL